MTTPSKPAYLPDVNVLLALNDRDHACHAPAKQWFAAIGSSRFFLCSVTESGFVRLTVSPHLAGASMPVAMAMLRQIANLPNCSFLSMDQPWLELVSPFSNRLHGYRQVTDALLLGLAIRNGAILVTLDCSIQALAGESHSANLLTLA
jgi:toxin-antitoxin system PIN domain toxin